MSTPLPPPGWHQDPSGVPGQRYWDGSRWTEHYAQNGVQTTAPTAAYAPAAFGAAPLHPQLPKSKTTAILLAVFLAFWMWIYTYKVDAWKFWLNLGLTVVTLGIWSLVAWPWSIIDAARVQRPLIWGCRSRGRLGRLRTGKTLVERLFRPRLA